MKQDTEMLRAGGPVTGRQLATLNLAQQFLGSGTLGVTALANYVGADSAQFLEYLIRSGTDFNDPKDLETRLAIARGSVGATVTAEERRRSENWLVKQAPGWFKRNLPLFGGPGALTSFELSDESCDGLARDLAPAVARIRKALPGIPYESAIQYAFHAEIGNQNTADFVDGTFVRHNPNVEGSQSFFQGVQAITNHVLSQSNEDYQHVVREEAHDLLRQVLQKQVASLNAEHANDPNYKKADTRNFRIKKDYVAVGGQQLGNGPLMLFYANKQTGQPYQVLLHPTAVRDRYVKYISDTRTKYDKAWKKLKATQIKIVR
ncbi:hypothetical protein DFQ30_010285 [Apophysomyces sp. BC1015]|nr:hypothetical protein DFQ30_010285 [Apophysomyces sp. BC1015]